MVDVFFAWASSSDQNDIPESEAKSGAHRMRARAASRHGSAAGDEDDAAEDCSDACG